MSRTCVFWSQEMLRLQQKEAAAVQSRRRPPSPGTSVYCLTRPGELTPLQALETLGVAAHTCRSVLRNG